jgi:hypothetical protein
MAAPSPTALGRHLRVFFGYPPALTRCQHGVRYHCRVTQLSVESWRTTQVRKRVFIVRFLYLHTPAFFVSLRRQLYAPERPRIICINYVHYPYHSMCATVNDDPFFAYNSWASIQVLSS